MENIDDIIQLTEKEEFDQKLIRASLREHVPSPTTDEDMEIYREVEHQIEWEIMGDSEAASSENSSFYDTYDEHLASLHHTAIRYTEEERQVDEAYERYQQLMQLHMVFLRRMRWIFVPPYWYVHSPEERYTWLYFATNYNLFEGNSLAEYILRTAS